jgi:glycosyltransferase involved in cell wall biosynthesis
MPNSSSETNPRRKLVVAWFTYFPVEWLSGVPPEAKNIPKMHPATWQRVLLEQFERATGLDLHIIVLRKTFPSNFSFQRNGVTFHCFKTMGGLRAPSLYWLDTILVSGCLARIKPDLCHAWGTEYGAAAIASRLPYPALVTVQGILSWLKNEIPLGMQMRISAWMEPRSLRKTKFATAESSFSAGYLEKHFPKLKVFQIEHAPDPLFFHVVRKPQTNPPRFVALSSFNYAKGADVLMKALDSLGREAEFQLTFIGSVDAALMTKLKTETSPWLWERTNFLNNLTAAEIGEQLSTATMMLYPSRADSSPNAVKEAVVTGTPTIASAVGGIVDHVRDGENGFLFKTGDASDCAAAIRKALAHPLFKEGKVEDQSLEQMRNYLAPETMAQKFLAAYSEVFQSSK